MSRISFRQGLLAGFLAITLLLGGVALRSWQLLEQYVLQSQRDNEHALHLIAMTQELGDRTRTLERRARQYRVLQDTPTRARLNEEVVQTRDLVARIDAFDPGAFGTLPGAWRGHLERLGALQDEPGEAGDPTAALSALASLALEFDQQSRQRIDARKGALADALAENRLQLTRFIVAAIGSALLVAAAMGWWLSRPVRALVCSIEQLGANRLDEPIAASGPADLRLIARRLDWLRLRLRDLESERDRTLRHVSHELKTPLAALREGISLLHEEVVGMLAETQREVVEILQHNVMSLQTHIEDLLRLNAVTSDARRVQCHPVNLRRLLREVVRKRELQIQTRQLTVHCLAPSTICLIDGEKLHIVIDNLLSNAIDFSPDGGLIRLDAALTDQRVCIDCVDHGTGVAPEDAARIFDPFVQGSRPSPSPRQGSGVGLSIVRELLTAMGGQVRLMPSDGSGTGAHFRIEVPYEQPV